MPMTPRHDAVQQTLVPPFASSIDSTVEAQFIQTFLSQSRKAQIGLLLSAVLVALIWAGRAPVAYPLSWLSVFGVVSGLRWFFTDRFVLNGTVLSAHGRVGLTLVVNGLLMSIPLVAFDQFSELERLAISIILMATATASTATTAGYKSVFLAFAVPMLGPLAVSWALLKEHDPTGLSSWGIGVLVTVYLGFLVSLGKQVSAVFVQSCTYRLGEQRLNAELTVALQRADESSRAKTRFLAAASHDLRQPLHSINVLVAALSLAKLDDQARAIVGVLDTVNQSFSRQLDGLLDLSKLDAGAVAPDMARHRLDPILRSLAQSIEPLAKQKQVGWTSDIPPGIEALTDATLLRRMVSNLADNALKFTPPGGHIRLTLTLTGQHACIEVADTGLGIPEDDTARVFNEFFQVANAERDRSKGLGLGLSIVQRLCRMLDIQVQLTSALGQGTTVRLTLPAQLADGSPMPQPALTKQPITPGCRVLVVDDEAMVRQSMQLLLAQMGCQVFVADSTEQALAVARSHPLDVVMADFRLRDHDSGINTLRQLKSLQPNLVAALITGDTAPDRIQDAQAANVPLLYKPVPHEQLVALLQSGRRAP